MPYPRKPPRLSKVGVGISLHPLMLRRVDALSGDNRSRFLVETIEMGLVARFGDGWREIADQRIETADPQPEAA